MSPFGCLLYYTESEYYSIKQCLSSIHEKREENLFMSTSSISNFPTRQEIAVAHYARE